MNLGLEMYTCTVLLKCKPTNSQDRFPYICAHGGDTTAHPPNTRAAYAAAIAAGVDCIELDVALTADGQLVASHSRDLRQLMARPEAKVSALTGAASTRQCSRRPFGIIKTVLLSNSTCLVTDHGQVQHWPHMNSSSQGKVVVKVHLQFRGYPSSTLSLDACTWPHSQILLLPMLQVADYTLQQLLLTRWATGDTVLTAEQALTACAPHVDLVIVDVKFSDVGRVSPACCAMLPTTRSISLLCPATGLPAGSMWHELQQARPPTSQAESCSSRL